LHRQPASKIEAADLLDRLVAQGVPGGRGLGAWQALLRAQATLIRQLDKDLEEETGLALADFDVLAQLALAGGELRNDRACRPGSHLAVGHDPPGRPAG